MVNKGIIKSLLRIIHMTIKYGSKNQYKSSTTLRWQRYKRLKLNRTKL